MEKLNMVDLIYEQMTINNPPRQRKKRHYPSGIPSYDEQGNPIGKCKRALVYSMLEIEPTNPIDPVALFKMDVGNIIHDKLDDVLTQALKRVYGDKFNLEDELFQSYIDKLNKEVDERNKEIAVEFEEMVNKGKVSPEEAPEFQSHYSINGDEIPVIWDVEGNNLPHSGRIDKIISINGRRGLGEWKSTYGFGANYIKKDGPKTEALLQIRDYLENTELPIEFIVLLYVARDSGYIFGYMIEMDENDRDTMLIYHMNSNMVEQKRIVHANIVKACREVEECVEEERVPDRDYHVNVNPKTNTLVQKGGDWQCRYCNYRSLCYGVAN